MDHWAHSFGRCQKPALLKARTQSACFFNPGLARALKSPGYTPGRLKHELCVVLGEKARAFGKTSKTKQTWKCGLVRSVFRGSVIRGSVIRGSVIRRSVFRGSVFRGSVIRGSVTVSFSRPKARASSCFLVKIWPILWTLDLSAYVFMFRFQT
jgi:hypothetical protein